jgi:hypothetical protein
MAQTADEILPRNRPGRIQGGMIMDEENAIPPDLREVFHRAAVKYSDWRFGEDEPTVSFEMKEYSISMICDLVRPYAAPLPESFAQILRWRSRDDLRNDLAANMTYSTGAWVLSELIKDARAEHRRRQQIAESGHL